VSIHEPDDIACGEQDEAPQRIRPDEYTPQAAVGEHRCPKCGGDSHYCKHACEFCGRQVIRLTVRWLAAGNLSDYCEVSPSMFHSPGGATIGEEG